jgi:two-component system, chemotaxis family, chemotaxis protein CheY
MKQSILVVNDSDSTRQFICECLQRKGYKTHAAANDDQAFLLLTENPGTIDLVLTDCNTRDCTGLDLLKRIKENTVLAAIPVIFLTTELNPDKMRQAKEAGLTACIKKPFTAETFYLLIERIINGPPGNGCKRGS